MNDCEKCHGTGKVACSTCKGKKAEPCKKCKGTGKVTCDKCDGDGVVTCGECYGTGKEVCPVCYKGKVKKTRWINCSNCHGTGKSENKNYYAKICKDCGYEFSEYSSILDECPECHSRRFRKKIESCPACDGRGQVQETYYDICPNCHGDYSHYSDKICSKCNGKGKVECDECDGSGTENCGACGGEGQVTCSHCKGEGKEKCPDCEKREKERKEREVAQKKHEEEQKRRARQEAAEKERARQAARQRAKKRVKNILGIILWRIPFSIIVGFMFWWWFEGFNNEALSGILEQLKGIRGGMPKNLPMAIMASGVAFIASYLLTFILSKASVIFRCVVQILSLLAGSVPAVKLVSSGHWVVGGWMALAIVCAISARLKGKAHESWWRWALMPIGLWFAGGAGMNGSWIISSVVTAFSLGIVLGDEN